MHEWTWLRTEYEAWLSNARESINLTSVEHRRGKCNGIVRLLQLYSPHWPNILCKSLPHALLHACHPQYAAHYYWHWVTRKVCLPRLRPRKRVVSNKSPTQGKFLHTNLLSTIPSRHCIVTTALAIKKQLVELPSGLNILSNVANAIAQWPYSVLRCAFCFQ